MILIAGATGLLGSHLLLNLMKRGDNVVAMYKNEASKEKTRKIFEAENFDTFHKIIWREGDLLDTESLKTCMQDIDCVFNCSGYISFNPNDREKLIRINIDGTRNLVNVALECEVKYFCHVSSIATLGKAIPGELITEETDLVYSSSNSLYTNTKYDGEMEVWRAFEEGLSGTIVKPSVILGYGDWNHGSASIFKAIYKGMPAYTTGGTGIVYVTDVCNTMIALYDKKIISEAFIINGENILYKELFTSIAIEFGKKPPSINIPKIILDIFWRIQLLLYYLFRINPKLSKNSVKTAYSISLYSNEKITKTINYKFSLKESYISNIVKKFNLQKNR
jgi:dihydroflavonol-4-reductase